MRTHYAFSKKIARGMNIFFCIYEYWLTLTFCYYFDQGRRSCPGASCISILVTNLSSAPVNNFEFLKKTWWQHRLSLDPCLNLRFPIWSPWIGFSQPCNLSSLKFIQIQQYNWKDVFLVCHFAKYFFFLNTIFRKIVILVMMLLVLSSNGLMIH